AFVSGLVWGWLPCGLVYSALVWALSAGNALEGSMIMLVFGLATLPALFLAGLSAVKFGHLTKNIWLRRAIGLILIVMALFHLSGKSLGF
ncbi:MAG: sulfite exporter TauE/SafE family protein, partial [Gammaproteobacteria bacterium]|nr:sulfite exporter TauE/SafE family protein [Gammaproteobacteria bacterium]